MHYSDKIFQALKKDHDWKLTNNENMTKTFRNDRFINGFNPEGELIVYCSFCERKRYLGLTVGFATVLDIDCRPALSGNDKYVKEIAKEFNDKVTAWIEARYINPNLHRQ